ncbi:MAG: MarR family transcriptional regulator [Lachnospiraceae bacterium]|nr:MarR family transcriptional regulator [Lachnospiraceae bacterium]
MENTLNELFVNLFHQILGIEEKTIKKNFGRMTLNDMHVIEAIGPGEAKNMSSLAKALRVTMGSLTISVNALVKKGYVNRVRSEKDRRVVLVSLTKEGKEAYKHHQEYHKQMIRSIVQNLDENEQEVLEKALHKLSDFFIPS